MASDYGDESGEKMLDNFTRFGERMGEAAMRDRALRLYRAFENAKAGAGEKIPDEPPGMAGPSEWAKLDMAEFREIDGYDEIKQIIEAKLRSHGVEPTWFEDKADGREYLLFRVMDAREVWDGFDELSKEAGPAAEQAAEAIRARAAKEVGEPEPAHDGARDEGFRSRQRPATQAAGGRRDGPGRRPSHAKTFWQKHDVPVLRDMRPLEERAAHAREASAALEAERAAGPARAREPRFQEMRSK